MPRPQDPHPPAHHLRGRAALRASGRCPAHRARTRPRTTCGVAPPSAHLSGRCPAHRARTHPRHHLRGRAALRAPLWTMPRPQGPHPPAAPPAGSRRPPRTSLDDAPPTGPAPARAPPAGSRRPPRTSLDDAPPTGPAPTRETTPRGAPPSARLNQRPLQQRRGGARGVQAPLHNLLQQPLELGVRADLLFQASAHAGAGQREYLAA